MKYLALTLPGGQTVTPKGIPSGGLDAVRKAVQGALSLFLIIIAIASLIYLIWGGMQWTASGGDKSKVGAARAKITYAIVGLVVAMLSFAILAIMGMFFGVSNNGLLNF